MDSFRELFAICTIGFIIRLYLIFIIDVQTFVNIFLYILHGSRKVGHERWYFTYHFAVWVQVAAISASRQTIMGSLASWSGKGWRFRLHHLHTRDFISLALHGGPTLAVIVPVNTVDQAHWYVWQAEMILHFIYRAFSRCLQHTRCKLESPTLFVTKKSYYQLF